MGRVIDLTGQKFNRLTVLHRVENNIRHQARWLCECDCENHTQIIVTGASLKSGNTKSCGCLQKEKATAKWYKGFNDYVEIDECTLKAYDNDHTNYFIFDKEDLNKINNVRWAIDSDGYWCGREPITRENLKMHRVLINAQNGEIVDHINRERNDNRKENLRIVSSSENRRNISLSPTRNTSGIIGVYWDNNNKKWASSLVKDRKYYFFGRFVDKEKAIQARLEGEILYFGKEFAPQRHLFNQYGVEVK